MPFILRRTKDAVLKDLPPKILQDIFVDPSPLQKRLHEDFARSKASQQAAGALVDQGTIEAAAGAAPHVFQVRGCHRSKQENFLFVVLPAWHRQQNCSSVTASMLNISQHVKKF